MHDEFRSSKQWMRQTRSPGPANCRQVFCSSKTLHPLLSLDLLHSLHAARMTQDSPKQESKSNDPGCLGGRFSQSAEEYPRALRAAEVLRQTAGWTATLGARSVRAMGSSSLLEHKLRQETQPDLSRPTQLGLQSQWRPPVAKVRRTEREQGATQTQTCSLLIDGRLEMRLLVAEDSLNCVIWLL